MVWVTDDEWFRIDELARPRAPQPSLGLNMPGPGNFEIEAYSAPRPAPAPAPAPLFMPGPGNFEIESYSPPPQPLFMPGPGQNDIGAPSYSLGLDSLDSMPLFIDAARPMNRPAPGQNELEPFGSYQDESSRWQEMAPARLDADFLGQSEMTEAINWLTMNRPWTLELLKSYGTVSDEDVMRAYRHARWGTQSALGVLGKAADTAMWPSDLAAEVGSDLAPIMANVLMPGSTSIYNQARKLPNQVLPEWAQLPESPGPFAAAKNVVEDIRDPAGAVEDFRSRPMAQQLVAGAVFDPLNLVGIGIGDDAVRAAGALRRGAGEGLQAAGEAVGRYGEDLAAMPGILGRAPTVEERLIRGAVDPATGMPFDYAPAVGGADMSLARGDTVLYQGQPYTVARKFTGGENATVVLRGADGQTVSVKRGQVESGPVANSARGLPEAFGRAGEAITGNFYAMLAQNAATPEGRAWLRSRRGLAEMVAADAGERGITGVDEIKRLVLDAEASRNTRMATAQGRLPESPSGISEAPPSAAEVAPQRTLPPVIEGNYRTDLGTYADTLYHETDPLTARHKLPVPGTNAFEGDMWYANTPDLATGQGGKTGVVIEYDAAGMSGQVNRSKPGWEFQWEQGNAEFLDTGAKGFSRKNARAVTISAETAKTRQGRTLLRIMDNVGWEKTTNPDGSVRYTRPGEAAETASAAAPSPAAVAETVAPPMQAVAPPPAAAAPPPAAVEPPLAAIEPPAPPPPTPPAPPPPRPSDASWRAVFGDPDDAAGAFGQGSTSGGRHVVPGTGTRQLQPDTPTWQLPDPDRFGAMTEPQRVAVKDFNDRMLRFMERLRSSGRTGAEIQSGRAGQAGRMQAAREAAKSAGLKGREAADFVRGAMSGRLIQTTADVPASVAAEVDYFYDVISRAYPSRPFDYQSALDAMDEALAVGQVQPRQRQILEAIFGDRMPDFESVTKLSIGGDVRATSIPMDIGPLSRAGEPPLIGESGVSLPARGTTPAAEGAATRLPIDQVQRRNEAWQTWQKADEAASAAERKAVGISKTDWKGSRATARKGKPLSKEGIEREETLWANKMASAKDQGAATEASRLREQADLLRNRFREEYARVDYADRTHGTQTRGVEMNPPVDATQGPLTLELHAQLPAEADMGVVPIAGRNRSVANAVRKQSRDAWGHIVDVLNLPRALRSTWDASSSLRQAAILGAGHPRRYANAFKLQMKILSSPTAKSEALYEGLIRDIRGGRFYELGKKAGLFLATDAQTIGQREEAFSSRLSERIPGVARSARAYNAMLDKMRKDVWEDAILRMIETGNFPEDDDIVQLAEFINHATGRGTGEFLDAVGDYSSVPFFAPRFTVSKPQAIWDFARALGPGTNPVVRKEVARSMGSWAAMIVSIYGLLDMADGEFGNNIGLNPRAGNFGKVSIGPHQLDLTGGLAIQVRTLARIVTGESVDRRGRTYPASRQGTLGQFIRGKLSPSAAAAWDAFTGKNYAGDPVEWQKLTGDTGALAQLWNLSVPLMMDDIREALEAEGLDGKVTPMNVLRALGVAGAAYFGSSLQSDTSEYSGRDMKIANDPELAAMLKPGETEVTYGNLSPAGKRLAEERYGAVFSRDDAIREQQQYSDQIAAEYRGQQEVDNASLQSGEIGGGRWRDLRSDRVTHWAGQREALYRNMPPKAEEDKDALDRYYDVIESNKTPNGQTDWDSVEAWVAEQPEADQRYIESNTGLSDTDVERQYRETRNALAKTGYFDMRDAAWEDYMRLIGRDAMGGYFEWKDAAIAQVTQQYIEQGVDPKLARTRAEKKVDDVGIVKQFQEVYRTHYLNPWIAENPGLAMDAIYWQYFTPTKRVEDVLNAWAAGQR